MYQIKLIESPVAWEEYVRSYPGANFLQSYNWGVFQASMGCKVWRLGLYKKNKLTGAACFYLEKAKRGSYFACPGGPLLDYSSPEQLKTLLSYVAGLARQYSVWFWRCRPQLADLPKYRNLFLQCGFKQAPMHMEAEITRQLDLSLPDDELLRNMRKNTRYSIKKALKSNLKIVQSTSLKDIEYLYQLQMVTQEKHKFVSFSQNFFSKQFAAFAKDNQAVLFKAYLGKEICAAAFVIYYKDEAVYRYAGNSPRAYTSGASYLIQWEAIKEAKKRGIKKYNFWGIAPENQPGHRFAGVSVFKRGFGGETVSYLKAQDYPFLPTYYLTYVFEYFRKKIRKL